ncbi:lipoprotein-releasing system ATP-binding protein LolD 2 [Algimonas arctica]|uniref:Lipoprotein-releasing system ATP-binding protein LolD 2 n=1 Tax=Algimonas arctica TaxID=1479486 RepID=A0A8J3CPM7_9PROT|nr:ABC transporter ATP-binding protein [Algimonas arctica]GHA90830.1 lipoprotein-releasing system ATP-binding protein LolD 2 [Algimonas arctica]
MTRPVLSVRNLHRSYKSGGGLLKVLAGADIDIFPGEMVGLIGPSGSGKSTLLHAAGLLEKPNAGEVFINGRECLKLPDDERTAIRRERIGMVYQFHHLQKEFTAEENVMIPQMIAGKTSRIARAESRRLLVAMGLGERLTHRPSQMSGGEQQRVAIARALANRPQVLLSDEPTGNLDPATSAVVFDQLYQLTRQEGVAALVATHNMQLASYMDRLLTVREGMVVPFIPAPVSY